ncbi:recombinase family protein [Brevibacterium aurantiacum]
MDDHVDAHRHCGNDEGGGDVRPGKHIKGDVQIYTGFMGNRGVIYGRASKDVKHTGTSVRKQIERGERWARGEGIELLEPIRDDNMGATRGSRERPGFKKVRALIEQRAIDVLILWEVSRSTRDATESMGLLDAAEDNNVDIAVDGKRYDPSDDADRMQLQFMFMMADSEGRRTKKRNIDSVTTNAQRGTPHGRFPYGYRRIYDSTSGVLLEQTPFAGDGQLLPEAKTLQEAASAVLSGTPLRRVCRNLNERGVPSPRKPRAKTLAENPNGVVNVWERATLRQLLLNPTIAGRRVYQGEDIGPAQWDAIVPFDEWLELRALLTDPSRLTVAVPRGPEPRHLLSGIARCGECGARMKASTNERRMKRAYACRHEGCMRVMVTAGKVDEMVEATILGLFDTPGFRGKLAAAHKERDEARTAGPSLSSQIAAKEAERTEIDGLRDSDPPRISLHAYIAETNRIEKRLEELRASESAQVTSPALRKMMTSKSVSEGWKQADLMDRREIIRMLLDVKIDRATVNRGRRFDFSRVTIDPSAFILDDVLEGQSMEWFGSGD